jgi:hypothetical protein
LCARDIAKSSISEAFQNLVAVSTAPVVSIAVTRLGRPDFAEAADLMKIAELSALPVEWTRLFKHPRLTAIIAVIKLIEHKV